MNRNFCAGPRTPPSETAQGGRAGAHNVTGPGRHTNSSRDLSCDSLRDGGSQPCPDPSEPSRWTRPLFVLPFAGLAGMGFWIGLVILISPELV